MNKVIVITGGTKGIGRALVDWYLKKGFCVATFSSQEKNTQHLQSCYPEHPNLLIETFDIRHQSAAIQFVETVIQKFHQIDTYIFNSGICEDKTFLKMTYEQWKDVIEINLTAHFSITQAIFRQMTLQDGQKNIFFMTSQAGITGSFGQSNYAASKAGLIGLSHTLALEGKAHNIKVNAISPAAVTDMTLPVIEMIEQKCQQTHQPFPKEWQIGSARDIAAGIYELTLLNPAPSGEIYSINGNAIQVYSKNEKKRDSKNYL
ncbi:SDR family oxidoreductase [Vagococcus hydrophili]|uniref:SDR family oxidoreductase n=1 Tax=Vagococcus hydrophili TaxID=2714947 RepID=A0A6G8ARG2_9ENTE|nr:SDR family oxidoreductase [Vagococcus hydrophili]QIL47661.1 SDR family oxidoreductase [Vagococcus hydrophili]